MYFVLPFLGRKQFITYSNNVCPKGGTSKKSFMKETRRQCKEVQKSVSQSILAAFVKPKSKEKKKLLRL